MHSRDRSLPGFILPAGSCRTATLDAFQRSTGCPSCQSAREMTRRSSSAVGAARTQEALTALYQIRTVVLQIGHDLACKCPIVADLPDVEPAGQIENFPFDKAKSV